MLYKMDKRPAKTFVKFCINKDYTGLPWLVITKGKKKHMNMKNKIKSITIKGNFATGYKQV